MNGNDIIKRLIAGEFYRNFHQIKYMVCGDNTLVVLADFRLDCGIIDKIHRENTFKHNIWLSFCDNGTVIDEVQRTNGKVFKVAEYLYHPSSMNEEDVSFIKEAILNINNGALDDSHNNPDSNSPTVRLKTTYRLTVEQNGINRKVRGEWGSKEEAVGIGLKLYKNHNQEDYIVFLVTVLRFPQHDGTAREMPFPCKIENITESKSKTNMKTENRKRNVVRLTESQLKQIVAEELKKALNEDYNHHSDYMEAKRILDGKSFEEIQQIVQNDKRFSYGSLNGTEGEGFIDLNFKSILLTVQLIGKVLPSSEEYDANDQFIGIKNRY